MVELPAQALSNISWSMAARSILDAPFMAAIASSAIRPITQCCGQALANTAWSFATLSISHAPLMPAIAASSRSRLTLGDVDPEFGTQERANTAWAFAVLV